VSDGLVADVEKLAQASHAGAIIEGGKVPLSTAARKVLAREPKLLGALLTGGDDYEIVAAVSETNVSAFEAEAKNRGVAVTAIGQIAPSGHEIRVFGPDGKPLALERKGFAHF
jgi:thiamine-monophosphate kinase